MTNREFFTAIAENEALPTDVRDFATSAISKLDARNEKRKDTPTKAQKENAPIKEHIVAVFNGSPMTAAEVAEAVGVSTQKASALLRQLVADGTLSVEDVKVPKKGTVKAYSLVG